MRSNLQSFCINSRRLCMALPSAQTKAAKTAAYTVQMFKCWSAKSTGSCVLYTRGELMSALWDSQCCSRDKYTNRNNEAIWLHYATLSFATAIPEGTHTHTTNACRDRISSESPQLRKAYPKCSAAQTLKSTVFLVDVNKRMIRLSHQSLKSPAVGIWIVPPTVAANKTLAGSLACEGKSVSLVKELESLRLTWQPNNTSPSVTLTTRTNNLGSSSSATVVCALVFSSQNQSFLRLYTEYFQNHQFKTQYLINNMNISKWFKIQRAPGVFVAPLNHRNRYGLISSHFRRWHRASQLWLTLLQACYHRSLPA